MNMETNRVNEDYGKWFQTEENDANTVKELMRYVGRIIVDCDKLPPEKIWNGIRTLGYINHSAFKVRPGMWSKFPNEKLSDNDYSLNKMIYSFKQKAIGAFIDYYVMNDLDVSTDEAHTIVAFREPTTGVRQITFHLGGDRELSDYLYILGKDNAKWDGVKQAHHYGNDAEYSKAMSNEGMNRRGPIIESIIKGVLENYLNKEVYI